MELHDIYYVPMSGGTNNSGRQRILSYGVWRHSDHRFLNAGTGQWVDKPYANNLLEQGRGEPHARFPDSVYMKGVYLPEHPTQLGAEPLAGYYTVFFYDRQQDKLVIHKEEMYVTPPPAPDTRAITLPQHEPTLLAAIAGLVCFSMLCVLIRR